MSKWSSNSWRSRTASQQAAWPDQQMAQRVIAEISDLPPLVTSGEIAALKSQLAEAARGERFVLHGGDCAESFADCRSSAITNQLKILLQMSLVLTHASRKRVVRIGRFAGQYAKPRSADLEVRDGVSLPSFRGDNVNCPEFTLAARTPNPQLLLRGYERSALTLNFIRALVDGGFADLHHPEQWNLDWVVHSPLAGEYKRMVDAIGEGLRFMEILAGVRVHQMQRVDFFTSHECLLLDLEEAQTRNVPRREGCWNLSTHFPWLGARTGQIDGAHVEYLRGIENPIGIKVSGDHTPRDLVKLCEALNPRREEGRITLIHRLGARTIAESLPKFIDAIASAKIPVLWVCDPMHGNTDTVMVQPKSGPPVSVKTRKFAHILAELEQAFEVHALKGSILGGVHFELTGENVTECTGGARGLVDSDLSRAYQSTLDPRLNYEQALEMALLVARRM
ncbi:MAG: 3-deoxy-7-phosphoheptulonate synthase class II [Planctomycetota bacterium]|nr:3-deoxy-7-phosphoheptulonate synthase class II [Planctomycetota bacterium]